MVFVLVTFELSLCTAGTLFPISLFLTLLLIRKENKNGSPIHFQGHSPQPHKIFEAGNQQDGQIFLLSSTILRVIFCLTTKPAPPRHCLMLFLPQCVPQMPFSLFLPSTVVQEYTLQTKINIKNKFFSLGHHLEKTSIYS